MRCGWWRAATAVFSGPEPSRSDGHVARPICDRAARPRRSPRPRSRRSRPGRAAPRPCRGLGGRGHLERHHVAGGIGVVGTPHVDAARRIHPQDATQQARVALDQVHLLQNGRATVRLVPSWLRSCWLRSADRASGRRRQARWIEERTVKSARNVDPLTGTTRAWPGQRRIRIVVRIRAMPFMRAV